MFFSNWFRPKPKFHPGQLVSISNVAAFSNNAFYLLIERRRWIRPNWTQIKLPKEWVYDGIRFEVLEGELVLSTFETGRRQNTFVPIRGVEY